MADRFIVAIGFSEGGLSPLTSYFDHTPHDNATYIILRHLPMDSHSRLQLILKQHSSLKIVEAVNETPIEKDVIYMSPPSKYMTIKNDTLYLHSRTEQELFPNRAIDVFLESLAQDKGKLSIAIILSGTGNDGSKGVSSIKKAGGIVLAQQRTSCEQSEMPLNAIRTGNVDHELQVCEMPPLVLQHITAILHENSVPKNQYSPSVSEQ